MMLQGNTWYCRYLWLMEAFPEMVAMSLYMAAPRGMTGRLVIFFSIILDFKILNKAQFCLLAQAVMFKKKPSNC